MRATTGDVSDLTGLAKRRWRQRPVVRMAVGGFVTAALVALVFASLTSGIVVYADATQYVVLGGEAFVVLPALLLWPFLRKVSYRKRDVLLLVTPIYGQFLCGVVVSRLMALPRRDWSARPDEMPRVVRIPGTDGAYVLSRSFADAEALRASTCRNARHQHPYEHVAKAPLIGCQPLEVG